MAGKVIYKECRGQQYVVNMAAEDNASGSAGQQRHGM
jgi:hypothetical protein